jgi:molybdopterin molybdotransferase
MRTVAEALAIVLQHTPVLAAEACALGAETLGRVLAEDVACDRDSPPHDKAMMDGYALRTADLTRGGATLRVIEEITAGRTPQRALAAGQAARIMTGAPVPAGADAVVMVERTREQGSDAVAVDDPALQPGKNIMPRGQEMRQGETVLARGAVLRPQELGLLATLGRTQAALIATPRVAVLSTGDELVDPQITPGPGKIRNSNGPMLAAQVCRAGARVNYLGIAGDVQEVLAAAVAEGLKSEVLVLSGGVSAGKLDLVPGVLESAGVVAHFHKVAMKPGKPVFFGTRPRRGAAPVLVFGLPGNPVSSLVCFELFVRPALRVLAGQAHPAPRIVHATLAEALPHKSDRPTYHPAFLAEGAEGRTVRARPWFGSPDLRSITQANAFLVLPAGEQHYRAGERMPVLLTDDAVG